MHGDMLKLLFKPIPIKTTYGLLDNLKEKNMPLKKWLDFKEVSECPLSLDKSCKNFKCSFNQRCLRKMVYENESE